MDSFELNKIAGAILFSLLAVFGLRELTGVLVSPATPEKLAFPVLMAEAEAPESPDAPAAPAVEEAASLAVLLAGGDLAKGQKLVKKCLACHSVADDGKNKIGPNLYGILADPKARAEGFRYSSAMVEAGGTWGFADLDGFLTKPKDFMPGTKMSFPGVKKPQDRANIILFLRSLGDDGVALPSE